MHICSIVILPLFVDSVSSLASVPLQRHQESTDPQVSGFKSMKMIYSEKGHPAFAFAEFAGVEEAQKAVGTLAFAKIGCNSDR